MLVNTGVLNIAVIGTLLFQGLLIVALLKQLEDAKALLETIDIPAVGALAAGAAAPRFDTAGVRSNRRFALESFREAGGVLLFVSPKCEACSRLIEKIATRDRLPDNVIVVWGGEAEELGARVGPHIEFVTANAGLIAAAYRIGSFPTAVSINGAGAIVRYGHPRDYDDLDKMLAAAAPRGSEQRRDCPAAEVAIAGSPVA
jgi:hypothetical protein